MKRNIKTTFTSFYFLLIVLLSTGFFYSCETGKQRPVSQRFNREQYLHQATQYLSQGEYDKAISILNVAIKENPDIPFGYLNRSRAYRYKGETDQSIADLSEAIELFPDFSQRWLTHNIVCNMDNIDECISYLNRAIELEPGNPTFYSLRGKTYLDGTDNFDQAISDFTRSIELKPYYPAYVYYFRGHAYMMKQQFDNARSDYNKAIQLGSKLAYTQMDYTADSNKDKVNTPPDKKGTRPRVIRQVEPMYPFEALKKNITGFVVVKVTLTKDGVVKDPVVVKAVPEGVFEESAIECIKKYVIKPATNSSGEPVDSVINVPISFDIILPVKKES